MEKKIVPNLNINQMKEKKIGPIPEDKPTIYINPKSSKQDSVQKHKLLDPSNTFSSINYKYFFLLLSQLMIASQFYDENFISIPIPFHLLQHHSYWILLQSYL